MQPIIVVSGLPRSGTSVMMQMLQRGGVPILTDDLRAADEDNPRGYLEFERVKNLRNDTAWLADARGRAVKIIHMLLMDLPPAHRYDVIFMRRDLTEVVASQSKMLERHGKRGAALTPERLAAIFNQQLAQVDAWIKAHPNVRVLDVQYADVIASPQTCAQRVAAFLSLNLDIVAMAGAVDPALHRNRS